MSCEIEDGKELAYCEQPLVGERYQMVRLIANHGTPSGHYRMAILQEDFLGRPHRTGGIQLVPVEIVPEADLFEYQDAEHQAFVNKHWVQIYEAGDVHTTPVV